MHTKKRWTYPSLACMFNKAYVNMPVLFFSEHKVCVCVCMYSLKASSYYVHSFPSSFVFFSIFYLFYNKKLQIAILSAICNINVIFHKIYIILTLLLNHNSLHLLLLPLSMCFLNLVLYLE